MTDEKNPSLSSRERIEKLRLTFVQKLPQRVEEARALLTRLEAAPGDRESAVALERVFHTVKGTARSFGFHGLGAAAARAEELFRGLLAAPPGPAPVPWGERLGGSLAEVDRASREAASAGGADGGSRGPECGLPGGESVPAAEGAEERLVFLCDDDPLLAEQLAGQLRCFGYRIETFADPQELAMALLVRTPSALVMDIMFPQGSSAGTDTLVALSRKTGRTVPAVFLSGRDDFEARLAAVRAGSRAYFRKPAQALDIVAALDELTRPQAVPPFRVLVVDDDPEVASYHALFLQEAGMTTRELSEPRHVLDVLADFRPDLLLVDLYMPGCDGHELAQVVRQVPEHVGVPIIYLSSETDRGKQHSAMRTGADGFLTKPVLAEDLVAAVAIRAERMRILRSLMARDSLTGLFNHTATTRLLEGALATSERTGYNVCFAMIDIDLFKTVNDTYGHPAGDHVIVALARILQQRLRSSDVIGRYGGEEFAVILPEAGLEDAALLIDAMRQDFSRLEFQASGRQFSCAFSAGVASSRSYAYAGALIEAADKALYAAKRSGRNRVVKSEGTP